MDAFALVLFGGLAVFVAVIVLVARFHRGSGLEPLGLKSAREITETREALEAEDLDQMVAARNARRRARGQPAVSASEVELDVARELGDQERRRQRYAADQRRRREATGGGAAPPRKPTVADAELDQLLAATNARRRARSMPERTAEQARKEFGGARKDSAGARDSAGGAHGSSGRARGSSGDVRKSADDTPDSERR